MKNSPKIIGLSIWALSSLIYYILYSYNGIVLIFVLPFHLMLGALVQEYSMHEYIGVLIAATIYGFIFYGIALQWKRVKKDRIALDKLVALIILLLALQIIPLILFSILLSALSF